MPVNITSNLDDLIDPLRLQLGDIDPTSYRYQDEWLLTSLLLSIKTLQRWWNQKYLVDFDSQDIYRNPNVIFLQESPPIIEDGDIRPIVLMASIIIKEGSLENNTWNAIAWRDAEISFSNLEGSRAKQESLRADWEELKSLLPPPNKKLASSKKGSLPGYKNNPYERIGQY